MTVATRKTVGGKKNAAPAKKKTPPVDKKAAVVKRKVAALKLRADAYKLKAREAFGQAKELSATLLKKKGVAVDGPNVQVASD